MPALPNWIPVREDIHEDPAILRIADRLGLRPEEVVGYCIRFWSWVSRNCNDGRVTGVSLDRLEQVLSQPGFLHLMCEVGWLDYQNKDGTPVLVIPNFDRWLSQGAKTRLLTARRAQKHRDISRNDASVTNALPQKQKQKQKQKQEKNPPKSPQGESLPFDSKDFRSCWDEWLSYCKSKRKTLPPTTVKRQLAKLGKMSEADAIASLEQSMENNWTGLFEPKRNGQVDTTTPPF